jgi:hypothetical protein
MEEWYPTELKVLDRYWALFFTSYIPSLSPFVAEGAVPCGTSLPGRQTSSPREHPIARIRGQGSVLRGKQHRYGMSL